MLSPRHIVDGIIKTIKSFNCACSKIKLSILENISWAALKANIVELILINQILLVYTSNFLTKNASLNFFPRGVICKDNARQLGQDLMKLLINLKGTSIHQMSGYKLHWKTSMGSSYHPEWSEASGNSLHLLTQFHHVVASAQMRCNNVNTPTETIFLGYRFT